jgi:hypothetical protein
MRGDREHRPSQSLIDLSWGRRCRIVELFEPQESPRTFKHLAQSDGTLQGMRQSVVGPDESRCGKLMIFACVNPSPRKSRGSGHASTEISLAAGAKAKSSFFLRIQNHI